MALAYVVHLLLLVVVAPMLAAGIDGTMSMWSDTEDTIVGYNSDGGSCKFADKEMGGLKAPTAQTPYIRDKHYCAVNDEMFKGGSVCGACYRITYVGGQSQGLGRAGSLAVEVVDSGSWATFDCHMSAFHAITGASTNIFPITYEMVPCATSPDGAVAAVLSYDYYWTKFVFSSMKYPVESAELTVGDKNYPMKRVLGYWAAWTGPVEGHVSFTLVDDHGNTALLQHCFSGWKNRKTGSSCVAAGSATSLAVAHTSELGLAGAGEEKSGSWPVPSLPVPVVPVPVLVVPDVAPPPAAPAPVPLVPVIFDVPDVPVPVVNAPSVPMTIERLAVSTVNGPSLRGAVGGGNATVDTETLPITADTEILPVIKR